MKYALLAFTGADWDDRAPAEKRLVHDPEAYRAMHSDAARLLAHYRFAPSRRATALELDGEELVRSAPRPSGDRRVLRALFLVESDDDEAVVELARRLPVLRLGGTIEIWPLAQPAQRSSGR